MGTDEVCRVMRTISVVGRVVLLYLRSTEYTGHREVCDERIRFTLDLRQTHVFYYDS